jgi:hypothetical protein
MRRHPALWLTIFLSAFYILLGNSRTTSGDGETMLQVTRALAERRRLDLPPGALPPVETVAADGSDIQIPYTLVGQNELTYSKYGLAQSLVALPLYLLGMVWRSISGTAHAPRTVALMLNSLLTAGTAGLLVLLARELGSSVRAGLLLALAFALCTPAWPYTHTFFSEPLAAFCLGGAALAAVRFSKTNQPGWIFLTGGALGLALFTRINALAALPAFALYIALTWRTESASSCSVFKQAALGLLGLMLASTLMLIYNLIRSGNPLDFGYYTSNWETPFFQGLYGLTLSPGKGILWYAPPIVLGMLGLPAFLRQHPREAILCVGILVGYILIHCSYTYWEGGWAWGPRLILPMLPFALLPAVTVLSRPRTGDTDSGCGRLVCPSTSAFLSGITGEFSEPSVLGSGALTTGGPVAEFSHSDSELAEPGGPRPNLRAIEPDPTRSFSTTGRLA